MSEAGQGAAAGAASGAAAGTMIMPGWGTAIGAVAGGALGYFGASKKKKAMSGQLAKQRAAIKAEEARRNARMSEDQAFFGGLATERSGELGTTMDSALAADAGAGAHQENVAGQLSQVMTASGPTAGSEAYAGAGGNAAGQAEAAEAQLTTQDNGRLSQAMGVATGNEMAQTERSGAMQKFSLGELMRRARTGDYTAKTQLWDRIAELDYQKKMGGIQNGMAGAARAGDGYMMAGQLLRVGGAAAGAFMGSGASNGYNPNEWAPNVGGVPPAQAGALDLGNPYAGMV